MTFTANRSIEVTFELPGIRLTLATDREFGDNPAFYAQQIEHALSEIAARARSLIETDFGAQR